MFRGPGCLLSLLLLSSLAIAAGASELDGPMREVETIRGLAFRGPVHAITIDRSELPGRLRAQLAGSLPYSVSDWGTILEALLLLDRDGGADPLDQLIDLYQAQAFAYYDPRSRTYVSVRQPPPALRGMPAGFDAEGGVIVHELTHALQDQHFDIARRDIELRKNTDAGLAYHAVLEGEASLVMLASLIGGAGADFDMLIRQPVIDGMLTSTAAADGLIDPSTPPYFAEMLKFPYLQGLRFVVEAYRLGGWAALDRVHADPPRSTREILHPEDYFAGFRASDLEAGGTSSPGVLTVERLGEFHWAFLVGPEGARGWTSDRVTIVEDAWCEPTVMVDASWESHQAALRFHRAYITLLDQREIGFLSDVTGSRVRVAYGADPRLMERFIR